MFDVITVGASSQDVFLGGKAFKPNVEEDGELTEQFPLGAKLEVDNVVFSTGGGATNAAVTFARNGLSVAFMGRTGKDPAASAVLEDLQEEGVDTTHIATDAELATDYSTILLAPTGERTILIYRGASQHLNWDEHDLGELEAKWAYITSAAGNFEFLNAFVDWANEKGIKVAMDPGKKELSNQEEMKKLLKKLTLVKANKEELGPLVGETEPEKIIRSLIDHVDYAIVTDGPNGSWATDGKQIVRAGLYEDNVVRDRTGAGDAFGSGFVASVLRGDNLAQAITFASANSNSVVETIGAKYGILRTDAEVHEMPLEISDF